MKVGSCMVFVIAYFFAQSIAFGQAKYLTYRLQGTVNRDTGTVTLVPTGQGFDPNSTNNYQTKLDRGTFY
ncbi:hypothetical protein [Spirosoma jeollabukense]